MLQALVDFAIAAREVATGQADMLASPCPSGVAVKLAHVRRGAHANGRRVRQGISAYARVRRTPSSLKALIALAHQKALVGVAVVALRHTLVLKEPRACGRGMGHREVAALVDPAHAALEVPVEHARVLVEEVEALVAKEYAPIPSLAGAYRIGVGQRKPACAGVCDTFSVDQ